MKLHNLLSFFDIFKKGRALEKRLLRNHLLAILVLITMVSISFLVLTNIIKTQENSSHLINKSGKQRMYTQRVLYYFNKYMYQKDIFSKNNIYENLEKLEENNQYLSRKLLDKNSISYYDKKLMYLLNSEKGAEYRFKYLKRNILKVVDQGALLNTQKIEIEGEILLGFYDKATLQYQKLAEDKVSQFLVFETSLYIISLLTIFLEALLIFRPAILEVFTKHTQLRKLNKNLSRQVKKKVKALREQEQLLIQQSKMAEMGEMLSNISHQWRQPLMILSMQIEDIELALEEEDLDKEEMQSSIENCFSQITLMSNTIEDFKRFYMPDNEKKAFNVYKTIEDIIQMEKSALQNYTIAHRIECEDSSIEVIGFEGQLKQVLLSLTNNAIEQLRIKIDQDLIPKDAGKIEYRIALKKDKVRITVHDNALGIPEDLIKKIFKPYFSTKENNGGSGIGLYMAKTIIEKNFLGKLSVKNKDKGAKFYIDVPFLDFDS